MRAIYESEKKRLESFLKKHKLKLERQLALGHSSFVFLVKRRGKKFALKLERADSTRKEMLKKEVLNLRKANSLGIGPKLYAYDSKNRIVLMEFVEGMPLSEWLFSNITRAQLLEFLKELFWQAIVMDKAGLDHGQLGGRGVNILVRNNKPVIIDFEKASQKRKAHNFAKLFAYLLINKNSKIALRVRELLLGKN
jgi:putative serine/threonine protein kinase